VIKKGSFAKRGDDGRVLERSIHAAGLVRNLVSCENARGYVGPVVLVKHVPYQPTVCKTNSSLARARLIADGCHQSALGIYSLR
jgi:hypothetical protein